MQSYITTLLVIFGLALAPAQSTIGKRIINGTPASEGQFPWAAAIYYSTPERNSFCGGTIVHPQWVLTSAHCVIDVTVFTIYLGATSLVAFNPNRVIIQTSEAIAHPDYNPDTFDSDVAIINLQQTLNFNDFLQPLKMDNKFLITGGRVTTAGWGKIDDASDQISEVLNYVTLLTISNRECNYYYGDAINGKMICAVGAEGQSTCAGDSGGALISFDAEGTPLHVGVATFVSSAGCSSSYPSGYTRTSYYKKWIDDTIAAHSL